MYVHMNEHNINYLIEALEITPTEANIYVHLLENGPATPLLLSKNLAINRTKIYRLLANMERLSLVNKNCKERGVMFAAANPDTFIFLLEEKERALNQKRDLLIPLINTLNSLNPKSPNSFETRPITSLETVKQLLFAEIQYPKVRVLGKESIDEIVGKPLAEELRQKVVDSNSHYQEILNTEYATIRGKVADYTKVFGFANQIETRYLEKNVLELNHTIRIYGEVVLIIQRVGGSFTGLKINNQEYAAYQKQLFTLLWEKAISYRKVLGLE